MIHNIPCTSYDTVSVSNNITQNKEKAEGLKGRKMRMYTSFDEMPVNAYERKLCT